MFTRGYHGYAASSLAEVPWSPFKVFSSLGSMQGYNISDMQSKGLCRFLPAPIYFLIFKKNKQRRTQANMTDSYT